MRPSKKLILGGAQIGQKYGSIRQSSFSQGQNLQKLFDLAKSAGFTAIDTARTYGKSEELLGQHSWDGELHTKLDERDCPRISLSNSLDALRVDSVDLLYVCHDASRVSNTSYDYWGPELEKLRTRSREIGAAIYPEQLDFPLLDFAEIQTIQIPFNVLSPLVSRKKVSEWKTSGKTINARSIFAQGFLVANSHQNATSEVARSVSAFQDVAQSLQIDPAELAFRWALTHPELDGIVLGIAQLGELELVASWSEAGPLPEEEFVFVEDRLSEFRQDIDLRKI
jgi:aryl-alcohol dehydrogenase-like predicted oxidoreductase